MVRKVNKTKRAARPANTHARKTAVKRKPVGRKPTQTNGKNGSTAVAKKATLSQKEQLQRERAQVAEELASLRSEMQQAPEMTGDEVDLNVYEREKTLGLVGAYERRLEELDAALRAAERGQYGICERCGNPIPPERLEIFPETRLCVSCKNQVEKEARRLRI
jgi:DnaK suppressor protein